MRGDSEGFENHFISLKKTGESSGIIINDEAAFSNSDHIFSGRPPDQLKLNETEQSETRVANEIESSDSRV